MSIVSAVNPATPSRTTPYITTDMFKNHAQAGVQVDNLVRGGSPAQQDYALREIIHEAAGWVDREALTTFAAREVTWAGQVNVSTNGYAVVFPPITPVIGLTSFSIGPNPSQLSALSSLAGIAFKPGGGIEVPCFSQGLLTSSQGPIQFGGVMAPFDQAWCEYGVVGGYPVTTLTDDVAQGATSLSVADTTGIVSGKTWLTVYALTGRFSFLAGAVSTADAGGLGTGPGTVTISGTTAPQAISNSADYPIQVTSLPSDLILANVLVTRAIIKQRSGGAVVATSATSRSPKQGRFQAGDDYAEAWRIISQALNPVGDMQL